MSTLYSASDSDGSAPIFQGAIRGKLIWGCDERVLVAVPIFILIGTFSGAGAFSLLFFAAAGGTLVLGKYLGATSPYCIDELSRYLDNRFFSWTGMMAADAAIGGPNAFFAGFWIAKKMQRKPKSKTVRASAIEEETIRQRAALVESPALSI